MKKAEEPYPPAPSAEDDAASIGNDYFAGISHEAYNEHLAHSGIYNLRLDNEEEGYVNDDDPDSSQSTTERYEQNGQDEPAPLLSNQNETIVQDQSRQRVVVESSQRPPAPLQYFAVPAPPPPAIIVRNVAHTAPVAPPQAQPSYQLFGGATRDFDPIRQRYHQPDFASTGGYFEDRYPRGVFSDGYNRGAEGLHYDMRPNRTMPTRNRDYFRQNERSPFVLSRSASRDLALREEPMEIFEMWADVFGMSRRIEADVAALRERLRLLHGFHYRS